LKIKYSAANVVKKTSNGFFVSQFVTVRKFAAFGGIFKYEEKYPIRFSGFNTDCGMFPVDFGLFFNCLSNVK
jgi:hypothetical protein